MFQPSFVCFMFIILVLEKFMRFPGILGNELNPKPLLEQIQFYENFTLTLVSLIKCNKCIKCDFLE